MILYYVYLYSDKYASLTNINERLDYSRACGVCEDSPERRPVVARAAGTAGTRTNGPSSQSHRELRTENTHHGGCGGATAVGCGRSAHRHPATILCHFVVPLHVTRSLLTITACSARRSPPAPLRRALHDGPFGDQSRQRCASVQLVRRRQGGGKAAKRQSAKSAKAANGGRGARSRAKARGPAPRPHTQPAIISRVRQLKRH